jgi:hypothetical protein
MICASVEQTQWRTAVVMITRNLVIAAPNWDPFYGLVVNCMKYDLAKVHIILRIGCPVNTITKQMRCWQMDSKGSSHSGIYISAIVAPMDKPTCGGVCKFIIHTWVKGFVKRGNGFSGTHAPTGCTAAAGQQGQRAQEKWYILYLESNCHKISQRHVQGCETRCGWRTWSLEQWNNEDMHVKCQQCGCEVSGAASTKIIISLSCLTRCPRNLVETCADLWRISWSNCSMNGEQDLMEHACQTGSSAAVCKEQGHDLWENFAGIRSRVDYGTCSTTSNI